MKRYKLNGGTIVPFGFAVGESDCRQSLGIWHYFPICSHIFHERHNRFSNRSDRDNLFRDIPSKDKLELDGYVTSRTRYDIKTRYYVVSHNDSGNFYRTEKIGKKSVMLSKSELISGFKKV